jgi:hypothetical protein
MPLRTAEAILSPRIFSDRVVIPQGVPQSLWETAGAPRKLGGLWESPSGADGDQARDRVFLAASGSRRLCRPVRGNVAGLLVPTRSRRKSRYRPTRRIACPSQREGQFAVKGMSILVNANPGRYLVHASNR